MSRESGGKEKVEDKDKRESNKARQKRKERQREQVCISFSVQYIPDNLTLTNSHLPDNSYHSPVNAPLIVYVILPL